MYDREDLPKVSPSTVFALFADLPTARIALEALLQGGFHPEQLGWLRANDSVPSAANNLATYRATGLSESNSSTDAPAASGNNDPAERIGPERELAKLGENAIFISVTPREQQEQHAREMLTALGGKLLRQDGSLESEEAA